MPNKKLENKTYTLPLNVKNVIKRGITKTTVNNKHIKGYKRANDLIKGERITNSQMEHLKNYYDNYEGDGKDDEYVLLGGDTTKIWVNKELDKSRTSIDRVKKAQMRGGKVNSYLKTHEKDNNNTNVTDTNGGLIDIVKSSTSDSLMRGDAIYKSSENKNESYNKEISEIKYLIEYLDVNKKNKL